MGPRAFNLRVSDIIGAARRR